MASILIYDQDSGKVVRYLPSAHTPDYKDVPNCLINPDLGQVNGIPPHMWRVQDGMVRRQTVEERNVEQLRVSGSLTNEAKDQFMQILGLIEGDPEVARKLKKILDAAAE